MKAFFSVALLLAAGLLTPAFAQDKSSIPFEQPAKPGAVKIVLVVGSNIHKPGEHEYLAGGLVLRELLKQTPNVEPVLALEWPKNPETFQGAKAVVFFFDGGEKSQILKGNHLAEVQKLVDAGAGLVFLHQVIDFPRDLGDRVRGWVGGAWEKGPSARAHWIAEFNTFPHHPVTRGVSPFKIDDGWLTKVRFVPEKKGVAPILKTANPKSATKELTDDDIVCWAYDRPAGGRSFTFTGAHLHSSWNFEGYRRLLTNAVLWSANVEVPAGGAPAALTPAQVEDHLKTATAFRTAK